MKIVMKALWSLMLILVVSLFCAAQAQTCRTNADCDDGRYCNGDEICRGGRCGSGTAPNCAAAADCRPGMGCHCDEDTRACRFEAADADGDGHGEAAHGGDDCDDHNPRRYPGAIEVCDPAGLDEDCNLSTPGNRDEDGDRHNDAACFNR
jgi:hypothetical protein